MRPLQQILLADTVLARWAGRLQREHALLQLVRRELPQALAAHVGAVSADEQELTLGATSGAAAALLRQRSPALLEVLKRSGWQFSGIRVCVQARPAGDRAKKVTSKQIDALSAARLKAGARKIPDPALAEALLHLAEVGAPRGSDDDPSDDDI